MNPKLALLTIDPLALLANLAIVVALAGLIHALVYLFCLAWRSAPKAARPDTRDSYHIARCRQVLYESGENSGEPVPVQLERLLQELGRLRKVAARADNFVISMISAERERQITREGWTPEHDDRHDDGGLADAAACYAATTEARKPYIHSHPPVPQRWPWSVADWKPTPDNRVRELVKAGALIVAEIERLKRAEARKESTTP